MFLCKRYVTPVFHKSQEKNARQQDPNDWRIPIIIYNKNEEEPDDKVAAERLAGQFYNYTLIGNDLNKRGAT